MSMEAKRERANREVKASAFTALFSEKENAVALCNALENTNYTDTGIIRYATLESVLFMARKNDLAFTAGNKILVLSEHQSTINNNMPLRSAIYFGRTLEHLIPPKSLYKSRLLKIPTPEFYMFYNGKEPFPAEQTMCLSDAYKLQKTDYMLDLKVKAININPGMRHPILKKCRPLYEYSMFIEQIRSELAGGYTQAQAIKNSIEACRKQGWLMDFLDRYGSEVENMLYTQFNLDDAKEVWEEEAREIGMQKGLEEGLERGLEQGLERGLEQGLERGLEQGLERVNQLNKLLAAQNRTDDIVLAAGNKDYQDKLFKEFGL